MQMPPAVLTVKDVYLLRDTLSSMLTIAKKMKHYSTVVEADDVKVQIENIQQELYQCYATLLEELS